MAGRIGYYGGIVRDGLVLDLDAAKLDSYQRTGTIWTDISGNGNNGTLVNGPTFDSGNGGSIVFDGVNDYSITQKNLGFSGDINTSISTWIYPNSVTGQIATTSIGNSDGTLTGMGICIGINGPGSVSVEFWTGNGMRTVSNAIQVNKWYNIIATKSIGAVNTTTSLYINGVSQSFNITSTNTPNITDYTVSIGAIKGSIVTQFYFSGKIGQTSIYNRTLSSQEVLQNYNATKGRYGL